jgi:hypothetical protein
MFTTKLYSLKALERGAKLAREHHLYVPGWCLFGQLEDIVKGHCAQTSWWRDGWVHEMPNDIHLALGFVDTKPVALALFKNTLMAFCKTDHRRRGYAARCVDRLKARCPENHWADEGINGSATFWEHVRVPFNRRSGYDRRIGTPE